ncbi:CYP97A6 [Auxenochlorella protothecoides x Auxenochlorella symbiontica]
MNSRFLHGRPGCLLVHPGSHSRKEARLLKTAPINRRRQVSCTAGLASQLLPWAIFFSPGAGILAYAAVRGGGNIKDGLSHVLTQVSQGYFQPQVGGDTIPAAQGNLSDLAGDEPLFKALFKWFQECGGVFKLEFGPKAFIVVSDPVVVRHLLKENAYNYDKGVLADILEPFMGKGLIPADWDTWKVRRKKIVPGFHKAYLNASMAMFGRCTERMIGKLDAHTASANSDDTVDMETEFLNLGLDIIGLGVFNYEFGSITRESPVIKAVYSVLKEAEHRSTFYLPYWDLPLASLVVPRQRRFQRDIQVLNECLDELIEQARRISEPEEIEALQQRDYSKVKDASLLRFLVDAGDADLGARQLRDDLMTMLIAGHETTAAVLTWTLYCLTKSPSHMAEIQAEVDAALGDSHPDLDDIGRLPKTRAALAESLRLYPQPPILIRRALAPDVLPGGLYGDAAGYPIGKGADLFISTWNLHRSPHLWDDPEDFKPERWSAKRASPIPEKWAGYAPLQAASALYPNEVASDFAFIPFGGGARKCVGDQFAMLEATVALAMTLRRYSFSLAADPGLASGATIHTAHGLRCSVQRREGPAGAGQGLRDEKETVALL